MPTGIISAGGRVFAASAAIPVLDAAIEETVDNSETAGEFVGEAEDVFVIGNGTEDEDEIGVEREALS